MVAAGAVRLKDASSGVSKQIKKVKRDSHGHQKTQQRAQFA